MQGVGCCDRVAVMCRLPKFVRFLWTTWQRVGSQERNMSVRFLWSMSGKSCQVAAVNGWDVERGKSMRELKRIWLLNSRFGLGS